MNLSRRKLLGWSGVTAGSALPASALANKPQTVSALGLDASQFGVHPGSPDDQSATLQRAIDHAAKSRAPLALPPGVYRAANLALPNGAQVVGIRGMSRLVFSGGASLLSAQGSDHVTLSGLVLDGGKRPLPERRGLVHLESGRALRILDCEIFSPGGIGLMLVAMAGEVAATAVADADNVAILSLDARGLMLARNSIVGAGNNGIQVWRSAAGEDGTMVLDNRVEKILNRTGGSGQYGNGINVFRAGGVIVRGNRIRDCAFTAVRGNSASNIQIAGNGINDMGEVAIYSEFAFEGAVIAGNTIDGAALGISVTNFNEGGRLAVVEGNIVRNATRKRPAGTDPNDGSGVGIAVEADTAVTGNVVENAGTAGFVLGFGRHLRDVTLSGNVVRKSPIGVAVSVTPGAGSAIIANNVISGASKGAIVGMDGARALTGDLLKEGAERHAHLAISGNRVS